MTTKTARAMGEALEYLGDDKVASNVELAAELGYSAGVMRTACLRLAERGLLRYSKVRSDKRFWRFVLTDEAVTRNSWQRIDALRATIAGAVPKAENRPPMTPSAMRKVVYAQVARLEQQHPEWKDFLKSCRSKFKVKLPAVKTRPELIALLGMIPFHPRRLNWWPVAIEERYRARVQRAAGSLASGDLRRQRRRLESHWARDQARRGAACEDPKLALAIAATAHRDFAEILDQASTTGLLTDFSENHEELREILALETLPAGEQLLASERELQYAIDRAHDMPADNLKFGRELLTEWPVERIGDWLHDGVERVMSEATNPSPKEHRRRFLSRFVDAWRRAQGGNKAWAANWRVAETEGDLSSVGGPPVDGGLAAFSSLRVALEMTRQAIHDARKGR